MIRNKSNIFSVDQGINRKKNGKLLQQCATRIDAVFHPYLDQPKKYLNHYLNQPKKEQKTFGTQCLLFSRYTIFALTGPSSGQLKMRQRN